jgi:hypothetical protein
MNKKGKTMNKSKKTAKIENNPAASNTVQSSYTYQDDPELLERIRSDYLSTSTDQFYWMMKLLSPVGKSRIQEIVSQKVDEMMSLSGRLGFVKPRYFSVPQWTINVIESGTWKRRPECLVGEIVEFTSFREFIESPHPMGMGGSLEKLRELSSGSEEALRMIDEVVGE